MMKNTYPKPIVYDTWESDKFLFKFVRIGGQGYLCVTRKANGIMISHTFSPNLKVARLEAEHYWM